MFGRLRRPGKHDPDNTLAASTDSARPAEPAGLDDEAAHLEALASELQRLGAEAPAIDQQRVWLRVQAAMRVEPQRRSRVPRFAAPGVLVAAPRLAVAGALAIALLLGAVLGSLLLQPRESVSAAVLEMQRAAQAAEVGATGGGPLSADDSAALEERALSLLRLASRPGVLADLGPTESELAYQRLVDARSALAAVVGENPGDTRALAALAAISGLFAPPLSGGPPQASTPLASATSSATASAAATATSPATATATATGQRSDATRTPEAKADGSNGQGASPAAVPSASAATAASAASSAQRACAHVYDSASLGACRTTSATALAACAQERGADGCHSTIEAAVGAAQLRVQRVGDDCQRLPS